MPTPDQHVRAADIVRDAGGQLVGRTRLQKVAYLTHLAGFSDDFEFEYRHYGPFSEDLARAMEIATGIGLVKEEEKRTDWGGWYSIYEIDDRGEPAAGADRRRFVAAAARIGSIELELAATAAFLYAKEGIGQNNDGDPWAETERRKPQEAAEGRLERAKQAYRALLALRAPVPLPEIA